VDCIAQTLASSIHLVNCWICLLRAQSVTDHSEPLGHSVIDFIQAPDGEWIPTLDSMAQTIAYMVIMIHYPPENATNVLCLALPLVATDTTYWNLIDVNYKKTWIPGRFQDGG
jgi:hypothetical protein